jgi:hypothetical protein
LFDKASEAHPPVALKIPPKSLAEQAMAKLPDMPKMMAEIQPEMMDMSSTHFRPYLSEKTPQL